MEAAELLAASLPGEMPAVAACLDLLLTWISARICDANMSCLLKVLALARSLLLQLKSQVRKRSFHPGWLGAQEVWTCAELGSIGICTGRA